MSKQATPSIRRAVIVGIDDYTGSTFPKLSFCSSDARALFAALTHFAQFDPAHTVLFCDDQTPDARRPNYSDIISAVKDMCDQATDEDLVLFAFAGHGTRDDNDSYLLTKEFRQNVLRDSSISMAKVNEYFQNSKAKFKLRLFDACHSGQMGTRGALNPNVDKHLAVAAHGWATLASCKDDQSAHELPEIGHGVFSYFFIKGLRGEAAVPGSSDVTLDSLKVYVMSQTIELTTKRGLAQTPVFRGEQAGNLVLATINNGTAVPGTSGAALPVPAVLEKIISTSVLDLAPAPTQTDAVLESLKTTLLAPRVTTEYVADTPEHRTEAAAVLLDHITNYLTERAKRDTEKLPPGHKFLAARRPLEKCALNNHLALYLSKSKVKSALNLNFTYEEKRLERKKIIHEEIEETIPRSRMFTSLLDAPSTRKVRKPLETTEYYTVNELAGVSSPKAFPDAAVEWQYVPPSLTFPWCSMTTIVLPSSFGLYRVCYFLSTTISEDMKVLWDVSSFAVRRFEAISLIGDIAQAESSRLDEACAEFVFFLGECVKERDKLLDKYGASPGRNLK